MLTATKPARTGNLLDAILGNRLAPSIQSTVKRVQTCELPAGYDESDRANLLHELSHTVAEIEAFTAEELS